MSTEALAGMVLGVIIIMGVIAYALSRGQEGRR